MLRVVPPSEPRDRASASTSTAAGTAETPEAALPPGPRRVLVVEDSPTIVAVVKYFLELEGFEVTVAENGQSGLEAAAR